MTTRTPFFSSFPSCSLVYTLVAFLLLRLSSGLGYFRLHTQYIDEKDGKKPRVLARLLWYLLRVLSLGFFFSFWFFFVQVLLRRLWI